MDKLVKELKRADASALQQHLCALPYADRRLRFGSGLNDAAIHAYVKRIDFEGDAVFAVVDDNVRIVGAAHLARSVEGAELGISVLASHRSHGIGAELLRRCCVHARNTGAKALFMHCLTENSAMMHLARKLGMKIVTATGEADAWLELPIADAVSHASEAAEQRLALIDYAQKIKHIDAGRDRSLV